MKRTVLARLIGREVQRNVMRASILSLFTIPLAIAEDNAEEVNVELIPIVVQGTKLSRYEFDEAESATGFAADIDEVPRTVQVIPEQLILDQNSKDLNDVLSNSAAVTRSDGFGGAETEVNIRGIGNEYLFLDGSPVSSRYNIDVANIESVEVVLGPASILHGQVSPGGLINVVTKKPQEESAHSVQMDVDEHGKQKLTVDSTGSLSDTTQYRIVISGEDTETYREVTTEDGTFNTERKSLTVSPSISYTPDDQNTFTLRLNHSEQELPIDRGTVMVNDGSGNLSIADIPYERALGSEYDIRDSTDDLIQFDWDYELDNGWTNKFKIGYYEKELDDYQTRGIAGLNDGTSLSAGSSVLAILGSSGDINTSSVQSNNLLLRRTDSNEMELSDTFLSNSLTGDYELGGLDNTLYIGVNYHSQKEDLTDGLALVDIGGTKYINADIINITDSASASNSKLTTTDLSNSDTTTDEFGLSIQNLTYVTDRLNVLAGARYDYYKIEGDYTSYYTTTNKISYTEVANPQAVDIDSSNDHISGQLGAIYDVSNDVSVYASYAESFKPNFPSITEGVYSGDFDPETAKQVEVGLKSSMLDDKLRLSVSTYALERKNVATVDGNTLNTVLNGETETNGVDVSATMQFLEGLNVLASYSYMDAEIIKSDDGNDDGNTPYNIPDHKMRLWGSYEIKGGDLAGLGFGMGSEYVSKRYGNDTNTFSLPSYTVYDASVWYYLPLSEETQLRLNAGVKNLTDEVYYTASGSNTYRISQGDPRTIYATARIDF